MRRERALAKIVQMLRLAQHESTPQGEREAAEERIRALVKRHEFSAEEMQQALAERIRSERPAVRRPPPPRPGPRVVVGRVVVMQGAFAEAEFTAATKTTFNGPGWGFANR